MRPAPALQANGCLADVASWKCRLERDTPWLGIDAGMLLMCKLDCDKENVAVDAAPTFPD
eukprot:gene3317-314_t